MKSDYIAARFFENILAVLTLENRLVMEVCLYTGLRVSDVLNMRSAKLARRMTVQELKTGKSRRITLPAELYDRLVSVSGKIWVFTGRLDYHKHRTRQAVYKDIKRAAKAFRLPSNLQVSPHTARKIYAVSKYRKSGNMAYVQKLLNHSSESITYLYAMADALTQRHYSGRYVDDSKV